MAAREKALDHATFEGRPIKGNRVKVMGASGINTDIAPPSGHWVRVTIEGPAAEITMDPQKDGYIREASVHASQQHATVELIEQPAEIKGQAKLEEAEPDNVRPIRDADGNVVDGPSEAPE